MSLSAYSPINVVYFCLSRPRKASCFFTGSQAQKNVKNTIVGNIYVRQRHPKCSFVFVFFFSWQVCGTLSIGIDIGTQKYG